MKYIFSLLIALWSMAAWGQEGGEGFNPSNPGEPGQRYNLTVNVTPDGSGSTSPSGKHQYALNENVHLRAYPNDYYRFVGWVENSDTLSRNTSFTYTMPARNTTVTAVFKPVEEFNPGNPGDPSPEVIKYKLNLTASPAEGGSFNINSGERFSEGKEVTVIAYPNGSHQFEGWKQGETLLSTDNRYTFVMGKEDVSLTALFSFNPANPGNPGANHWNAETGELIVDDFTPGRIMDAVNRVIGGSGNRSKVTMMIVSGTMRDYDFGIANELTNCSLFDLSRTGGYTDIPGYAFDGTNLSTIILPACLETIGYNAFENCQNLTDITCYALTPPVVESNAFRGISDGAVVHVLSSAIPLYAEAEGWKEFTILPLTEDVKTLEVSLPAGSEGAYKNMTLELQNLQNGQKQRYVVSDRLTYTFNGLLKNCTYNVSLKTPTGTVLGQIEKIEIKDEDRSVTFESLLALLDVELKVQTPDGTDVTDQVQVTWLDAKQAYLSQGSQLKTQTAGTELNYRVVLNQELGMQYVAPDNQTYTVQEQGNGLVCTLAPIEQVTVTGLVKDANGGALSNATVSISQKLNGKYSKSFIGQTDTKGKFELQVYNDESTIAVSATDYISQTVTKADFSEGTDLGTFELKTISGATIQISFTYTPSVAEGEEAGTEEWYSDHANVSYSIHNETQDKAITQYSVQFPSIVLLEEVAAGDRLSITASSKNNSFLPVKASAVIDENNKANASLNIISLGGFKATYTSTDNTDVAGILYDSKEELLRKYTYKNASLSVSGLADGVYTLVSMSNSDFFNSILKLSSLKTSGLTEGTDYILNTITVKSGVIAKVHNESIPALDESKLYYTNENTAFTVNKASIVAGNYLTLKGKIDFKEEYASAISNVQLVIDLPESCSFVESSAMVGNQVCAYTLDGSRLTIPMANYSDLVRFCIIPAEGGTYSPNAFIEFTLNGKDIRQPIGSARYEVKNLSISVPKIVAKTSIPISGTAQGGAEVSIYDEDLLIGKTTALANGVWATTCELNKPYNLSVHNIYAKVKTKQGLDLQSESKKVTYDMNSIQVSKVTMYHDNPEMHKTYEVVFDFQNPSNEAQKYIYYIYNKMFTFTIDFTNNDPALVSNVILHVKTGDSTWRPLKATYDEKKDIWVASGEFGNMYDGNIPVNVSVDFEELVSEGCISPEMITDAYANLSNVQTDIKEYNQAVDDLHALIVEERSKENVDLEKLSQLYTQYFEALGMKAPEPDGNDELISDAEMEQLQKQYDSFTADYGKINAENLLSTLLSDIHLEVNEDDVKGTITVSTCEEYTESELEDKYIEIVTTDGNKLYVCAEEDKLIILDFVNNVCYKVLNENLPSTRASSDKSFADRMNGYIDVINKNIEKATDITSNILGVIDEVEEHLQKGIKFAQEGYGDAWIQLDKLRRAQAAGKPVAANRIFLLELICDGYEAEYKGLKGLKEGVSQFGSKFYNKAFGAFGIISAFIECKEDLEKFIRCYFAVPDPCEDDEANADKIRSDVRNAGIAAAVYYIGNISTDVISLLGIAPSVASAPATAGSSLGVALAAVGKLALSWGIQKAYEKITKSFLSNAYHRIKQLKCYKEDPDDDSDPNGDDNGSDKENQGGEHKSGNPDSDPAIDPSGYVYEAVETNRLQGVTATCYYKTEEEDMYGDKHEKIVLWDAAEYAQENPLFTDENGMYRWDVPQGLWQVKFEKEGYQTTYSEWLPVPPPQLEVNIGMVQTAQPTVAAVRGYDTGVEIDFSKFMLPETMTTELITLNRNGEAVAGEISFKNAEANPQNKQELFVSKVRFVPAEALATTDKVVLTVSKRVKSYAGIQMESDYSQEIPIEKEPKAVVASEIEVPYNGTAEVTVTVEPLETATGKKVTAASVSSSIAVVQPAEVMLNEEGKATFTIAGELPGQTMIRFEVEGMEVKPEVKVNVVEPGEGNITRNYTLAMGWNWFSINVQNPNLNDIPTLLSPIRESVISLKGAEGELTNNGESGWEGALNSLSTTQAYKIKMKKEATLELTGKALEPTSNTITLNRGWNWMGYVPTVSLPVEDALQNLQAEANDIIKGLDSFAVYDGSTWTGSLTHLLPGEGYMYYSQSVKSFNYAAGGTESEPDTPSAQWEYDAHHSEDNLIVLAELYNGEQKAEADRFLVGAFVNDECRGVAVEKEGYLFITVHGEQSDGKVTLRAFDTTEQQEYTIKEEVEWTGMQAGSLSAPVSLHVGEATGINPVFEGLLIYPSPVRHRLYLRGDIGSIEEVRISNISGQTVILEKQVMPNEGIDVSSLSQGIYFILVKSDSKVIKQKFMKVN